MDLLPVAPIETLRQRRSAKWRFHPSDVLPLPVAEMDFDLAPPIQAALRSAIERSDTGYPAPVPTLSDALAGFAGERWGWEIDPASVTAVADVGVGVVELLRVLARPGDPVVICPPVYPPFFDWVPEAGGRVHEVPLADGRLDLPGLERAFATHPAAFVLCNPHNPVGRVHTRDELTEVVRLATAHGVPIVSDEIHAPLVLPGATFTPILTVPGAAAVAVSLVSTSKAWNLAGLKCATIVTASPQMAALTDRLPPDTPWRIGHFGVLASVAAYTEGVPWLDQLLATLDARRALLGRLLAKRLPMVSWRPPDATFLAWLDCSAISAAPRDLFFEKGRVALEPGPRFGAQGSGHVRLNFGTSAEILEAAIDRMARATNGH
ncbi:cystathionine beta-lyase [Asanoa ishikariensis]|uniref:cysteine-S-conjugate beta-lyase n=1 Tax=Asanoa ishikariensis TaxID=137265 RepID=A0A1H3NIN2_9ACTN|nr:aminotransferase class I/II-fold pyridoxal phosphate-dependent enzyme [Asanoa ishikariensis]GIF68599.1 cystathionine beta-lyase [Asanoa ishikariensis]SDY88550.1 cystathione beta-lyase [Asanoa ishikariensis]